MIKKILGLAISLLAVLIVGVVLLVFLVIGGLGFINNIFTSKVTVPNPNTSIASVSRDLGNFSSMSKNYRLVNSVNLPGVSAVVAEANQNKQKIIVINTGPFFNITKQDIQSNNIDSQIKSLLPVIPKQIFNYDKLEIAKKGSFKLSNQTVPYMKVNFGLTNDAKNNSEGIIGVIDSPNKKSNLFISLAGSGKFKMSVVEDLFKQIKYHPPEK